MSLARKWKAVFAIYFQDGLAYRASGIIWVLTDVTTAVTMPLVWASASAGRDIAGYSQSGLVMYYLGMLLLGSFITSHMMWEVAMEIKEGVFSTYLVRPISFLQFMFFRNIAWRIIRTGLFLPFAVGFFLLYQPFLHGLSLNLGPELWLSVVLGHLVSFTFVMMMAMLALFTQEAMSIFELYYIPMLFLSGQLFPVAVMPGWVASLSRALPFYYTTGAPTEILIGRTAGLDAWRVCAIQAAWALVLWLCGRLLWKKGLRYYTGVGM